MPTVLIVGAAGGVGSAAVKLLLARGDTVIGSVMNDVEENYVKRETSGLHSTIRLDLSSAEQVKRNLISALGEIPQLDAVVVCAAYAPLGPLETMPLELARKTLEVNTLACIAIYQAVLPRLRERRGRLVFISSMAGRIHWPFIGSYTASKHGLEGAADVMRCEAARWGVEIILIEPGGIRTGMVERQLEEAARDLARLSPENEVLYGDIYRQFLALARAGLRQDAAPPEAVAADVLRALDESPPATRYISGSDAKQLINARFSMPDRDFDALALRSFSDALAYAKSSESSRD